MSHALLCTTNTFLAIEKLVQRVTTEKYAGMCIVVFDSRDTAVLNVLQTLALYLYCCSLIVSSQPLKVLWTSFEKDILLCLPLFRMPLIIGTYNMPEPKGVSVEDLEQFRKTTLNPVRLRYCFFSAPTTLISHILAM